MFRGASLQPMATKTSLLFNSASSFDAYMVNSISTTPFKLQIYDNFQCSVAQSALNTTRTNIQFFISFQCAMTASQSQACWDPKAVPAAQAGKPQPAGTPAWQLCRSSCDAYVNSLETLLAKDAAACAGPSQNDVKARIKDLRTLCATNVHFNATSNCIDAAQNERATCGRAPLDEICTSCSSFSTTSTCKNILPGLARGGENGTPGTTSGTASDSSSVLVPVLIGTAAGGVAMLVCGFMGLFLYRRKQQQKRDLIASNSRYPPVTGDGGSSTVSISNSHMMMPARPRTPPQAPPRVPHWDPGMQAVASPVASSFPHSNGGALREFGGPPSAVSAAPSASVTITSPRPRGESFGAAAAAMRNTAHLPLPAPVAATAGGTSPSSWTSSSLKHIASPHRPDNMLYTAIVPANEYGMPKDAIHMAPMGRSNSLPLAVPPPAVTTTATGSRLPYSSQQQRSRTSGPMMRYAMPLDVGEDDEAPTGPPPGLPALAAEPDLRVDKFILPSTISSRGKRNNALGAGISGNPLYELPSTLSSRGRENAAAGNRMTYATATELDHAVPRRLSSALGNGIGIGLGAGLGNHALLNGNSATSGLRPSPVHPAPSQSYYVVIRAYAAASRDEMSIAAGDMVLVQSLYSDGWAYGMNTTQERSGMFPLICTVPVATETVGGGGAEHGGVPPLPRPARGGGGGGRM
ncbi:hypothetical protein H9P43_002880 [Blastocladiella emersonii ATCC 22665]|nr:hypothetical protein H9P43_002880 [Blastocladiella emersonii ATCC 22665]